MAFDRLSRIAALRPLSPDGVKPPGTAGRQERHARLAELLGAELRTTTRGQHLAVTRRAGDAPSCAIGPRALRLLAPQAGDRAADSRRWLFLDTETTGLSGGTGTYAFLVGLGWWEQDGFVVEQLFMRDHSEEPSLLRQLSQRLAERDVLVTFNGKSFDWPLLETRFRMAREAFAGPAAHLDLLHPARQLWRLRLKSVALSELEREVLRIDRGADIPSHTIPAKYFEFLRGGPVEPIVEIFHHNRLDLIGLAALAERITRLMEEPDGGDAGEMFGLSRMLQRRGEERLAARGYQQALLSGLSQGADRVARRELALMARRIGDFATANALWEELVGDSTDGLQAYEQLAIYHEHRARDSRRALELTREALVRLREGFLAGRIDPYQHRRWHDAFRHRLSRLEKSGS